MKILENRKDLQVYKQVVATVGEYIDKFPATAIAGVFNSLLAKGITSLPKDEHALNIIAFILSKEIPIAAKVNELMNFRFSDLPFSVRPVFLLKPGQQEVAVWQRGGQVYDRVLSLINVEETGESGKWSDASGEPIKLIVNKENQQ